MVLKAHAFIPRKKIIMERSCYESHCCTSYCGVFMYYFCMDVKQIVNYNCTLWKIYGKWSKGWLLWLSVINIIIYALILHYKDYIIYNETTIMTQELVWTCESSLDSGYSRIYSLVFKENMKYVANYSNLIAQDIEILQTSLELMTMVVSGRKSMSKWKEKKSFNFSRDMWEEMLLLWGCFHEVV